MNYAVDVARVRAARDRAIDRAQADARAKLAELTAQRDAEIHRLRAQGLRTGKIVAETGCSRGQVYEVLHPEAHARYNARRRKHWHVYKGGRAA